MIQKQTKLNVADNSGAKSVMCIGIPGGTRKRYAFVGQIILVAIKEAVTSGKVKKGQMAKAVVVRTVSPIRRKDGSYLKFDDNAVVLINDQKEPIGTRVFGAIAREVKNAGYMRIASLVKEVV